MNTELVTLLRSVNVLIALAFVLVGAIAGSRGFDFDWLYGSYGHFAAGAGGAFLGLVAASLINGTVAALLEIELHLRAIKDLLRQQSLAIGPPTEAMQRDR